MEIWNYDFNLQKNWNEYRNFPAPVPALVSMFSSFCDDSIPGFPLKEGLTSYLTSGKIALDFLFLYGLISHYFAILLERPSLFFNRRHPNPRGSPHGAL